ncbi:unnamed protein product (macronuclear) [Paramecium tetraurelia]|uniref:Uncharacterized protein n=1 Tax=Paramecium tetraurelia TaxID=5888 RepID=A0E2V1_PARTE|nr:uncharacterized protein GSPATT00022790001 [Paramecium tetraurelia]CAK89618.1 unnamed protein product [Paramecium tetraurelia]|eukprot:XP_001457015.1 hypothetical protein (macronuclear) [Paramecium tetraurelia strain d4-2]
MGICITKPNTKNPQSLIRLIKVENENQNSKPTTLPELYDKILEIWMMLEKKLNKLVNCQRTENILELKKQIRNILNQQKSNAAASVSEVTIGIIVNHMEKIAFEIEELIREDLLNEDNSNKFKQFYTQILELSLEYYNWKNIQNADVTQVQSFI